MAEPYLQQVSSQALKIRWISVQCYEIVLPNGKVIVTDPFYLDAATFDGLEELTKNQMLERDIYSQRGFSVDDFTGADYIILSHVHGDHTNLVGQLWNKFYGRVLCPAECCAEVAKAFDIPVQTFFNYVQEEREVFQVFRFQSFENVIVGLRVFGQLRRRWVKLKDILRDMLGDLHPFHIKPNLSEKTI